MFFILCGTPWWGPELILVGLHHTFLMEQGRIENVKVLLYGYLEGTVYVATNAPLPFSVCLTHSEHWVVSVVYFLLWVAVSSLRNVVLHFYSSICGHHTSVMGFHSELLRNVDSEAPPLTHWIRTCPHSTIPMGSMHTRKYENLSTEPLVLFQYLPYFYSYFFLAGSHLSKVTLVLAPWSLSIFRELER